MTVVDQMPDSGQVVIAHPNARLVAGVWAEREGLDLFLTDLVGTNGVYIMDVDAVMRPAVGEWKWKWE